MLRLHSRSSGIEAKQMCPWVGRKCGYADQRQRERRAAITMPPSAVMEEPAPPRLAVVSGDTKVFDRGRRRGKHTHTQPV
eukprot:COSAG01_NODE_5620_length_4142_cov_2.011872_1_plen_79_part_10